MPTPHAVDALTALACADDPARAREALTTAIRALGADAPRFAPLMETLCARAQELGRLRRLAGEDELTGVANRRGFHDALEREVARLAREGQQFGILLLDLDGLKQINDTLGHQTGDQAIIEAANGILEAIRASDVCGRLGGDELAVLLPNTDRNGIAIAAERIRRSVESRQVGGRPLRISVGWAVADSYGVSSEELMGLADARLYTDKHRRKGARAARRDLSGVRPAAA